MQKFAFALIITLFLLPAKASFAAQVKSGFDKAWSYMTLYSDKANHGIQKFAFVGRAQIDAVWVDPKDQENWNDLAWRRFRAGFKMDFLQDWVAHIEADFDLNEDIDDWRHVLKRSANPGAQ